MDDSVSIFEFKTGSIPKYCFMVTYPHNLRNVPEWVIHMSLERNSLNSPEKR